MPLNEQPTYNDLVGAFKMLAQAVGPVLCGAIVTRWCWRWFFKFNIPAGLSFIVLIAIFLRLESENGEEEEEEEEVTAIEGCTNLDGGT